ncbi:hypothetical protein IKG12_00030 [Candidatus Saccharibacteria bacterium]|nr:hypothetical protein [Candidatus Saccharibacteria bacterium]
MPKNKSRNIILAVSALIVVLAGVFIYLNRIVIYDWLMAMSYRAPAEVAEVENKIALTDRAKLIFAATHPSMESREDFNEHCNSHEKEISILGCYSDGKVHIYNIQSSELNGILESTAAHELLHAVWDRTDSGEKSRLTNYLMDVYNDEKYHDLLSDDLDTYEQKNRIDELHSRIGTEIADLPEELEKHYARYFTNQDLVVDFYNSYITPFKELDEEIKALSAELESSNTEIEEKSASYYARAEQLLKEVDEFNACANTSGCFASNAAFLARRNQLMAEQVNLDGMYDEINSLVNHYNTLVIEYNANVLRGEELEKAMNSNAEIESEIK